MNIKWTKDKSHHEALKFSTRKEFEVLSKKAYRAAYRNGWLDEVCSHMMRYGNRMFRCVYVYEFSDNCAYIGLTYNLKKRNSDRKLQKDDAVTKHIEKTNLLPVLKQLSEYIHLNVAAVMENDTIEFYKGIGWNVLNRAKGGTVGGANRYWTKELCQVEALKFNSRGEFYYKNNTVYSAAVRYGWLNEICEHMVLTNHVNHRTIDEIKREALKYEYRFEFSKNDNASYNWAIRHNVLDEVCSHMTSRVGTNQHKQKIR